MRLIPKWLRERRTDPGRPMTMVEHLQELRRRIVISVIALAVGAIAGWFVYGPVFNFLIHSYTEACHHLPKARRPPQGCNAVVVSGVVEPFLIRLKVSTYSGLALALPVVLFQLWRFITPGLTQKERRLAIPFVFSSLVLFALGGFFAFLTLPKGLNFLLGFGGPHIVPLLSATRYISFVILLTLAFGVSFEFPLVLIFLAMAHVITSRQLRDWRRWAWLSISIFAAVITPSQDPYTMLAMMVPMIVFYELSILVARLLKR
jgi:sec-independent protein translocase protein TatC